MPSLLYWGPPRRPRRFAAGNHTFGTAPVDAAGAAPYVPLRKVRFRS
ncbi:hypothetical protein NY78_0291 [Desulfovibrio sp. TomC]|nr:hypothetical protein NY78_0291 [Desulfovibrio sp. TomC]